MDKKTLRLLNHYIDKYFYYVEYPDGLDKHFWKDTNGKKQLILVMPKEEITNCINRINADMNRFYGCQLTETQKQALDAILPLAQRMKDELEEQLEYQKQQEDEAKLREDKARQQEDEAKLREDKARQQEDEAKLREDKARQQEDEANRREDESKQQELSKYLEFIDEKPRKKPLRKRSKPPDTARVPIRALLPLWMVKRLEAEGDIGTGLEKYLLKGGIKGDQATLDPALNKIKSAPPPNTNKLADAWKKDIKNILNSSVNAILGFTQLALSPYKWPEETMNNYLNSIEKATQRMKSEIDKF
ncbi:hypothetical protein QUF75_11660 [Desulfococcaceae bacterium HSG7]|nr:hypothetical protein [Desulfococcaceae bacterium HSG7]